MSGKLPTLPKRIVLGAGEAPETAETRRSACAMPINISVKHCVKSAKGDSTPRSCESKPLKLERPEP